MSIALDLSGRTALVTGSTGGIGLAIALALGRAGAHVLVNGRGAARVDAAVARAEADVPEGRFTGVVADVTDAAAVERLVAEQPDVDVVVDNLGVFGATPALEIDDDEWRRSFDVNVLSAVRLTRAYLPRDAGAGLGPGAEHRQRLRGRDPRRDDPLRHQQGGPAGRVARLREGGRRHRGHGERRHRRPDPHRGRGGPRALPRRGGPRLGRGAARVHADPPPQSLLQRLIEPEAIANLVVTLVVDLASDLASATTGGALRVDGGYVDSILP